MYPLNSVVHFSLNEMMNTLLFLTSILLSGERDSCLYCALGHQSRSQRSFSFSCCRYCSLSWPYTLLLESVKPAHRNPRSNEREEFTTWIGLAWRGPFWPWIWWVATASVTSRHPPKGLSGVACLGGVTELVCRYVFLCRCRLMLNAAKAWSPVWASLYLYSHLRRNLLRWFAANELSKRGICRCLSCALLSPMTRLVAFCPWFPLLCP